MFNEFESLHNYFEQAVFDHIAGSAALYPAFAENDAMLADVACVALNRLPPRYVRNNVDMNFYMSSQDRAKYGAAVKVAVEFAFRFVQSRAAGRPSG